jgi:hypothetical protein
VETIEQTPTRRANYALISAVYGAGLTAVARLARRTRHAPDGRDLVPLGVATFTFTRVLSEQKVEEWLRSPFLDEPGDAPRHPKGHGLRYAIGELLSCTRCTGSWVGLGLVGLHAASPSTARIVSAVGTVGAVNDAALAGFAWLTGHANAEGELATLRRERADAAVAGPLR